jgi:hypothetical protein
MTASSPRPEERRSKLNDLRTTSLDSLSGADVSAVVQKVIETRRDQARITAAKFSSFI